MSKVVFIVHNDKVISKTKPTKQFLEKSYGKKLTDVEVADYKNRLVNFFSLLVEIDQRNERKNNDRHN